MPSLNNFKIVFKVSLIVALMAVVTLGTAVFATHKMRAADDANTDVVTRVDKSTTLAARAGRLTENYLSSAFQLAAETTDEGNVKYLAQTVDSRKAYEALMATILKEMPEKKAVIESNCRQLPESICSLRTRHSVRCLDNHP